MLKPKNIRFRALEKAWDPESADVYAMLDLDMPLPEAALRINDENYWKRRTQAKHPNAQVEKHGMSWKQTYLEIELQEALERVPITVEYGNPELEALKQQVMASRLYVYQLQITQFPSHLDLSFIFDALPALCTFSITYGNKRLGMDYERAMFGMKISDAQYLARDIRVSQTLVSLSLPCNMIDDELVKVLMGGLSYGHMLTHLDLSHNKIGDRGARRLASLLDPDYCLQALDLSDNQIHANGCMHLGAHLAENITCQVLNLRLNRCEDNGVSHLFQDMCVNKHLQTLNIACNDLTVRCLPYLNAMLAENGTLLELDVSANPSGVGLFPLMILMNVPLHGGFTLVTAVRLADHFLEALSRLELGLGLIWIGHYDSAPSPAQSGLASPAKKGGGGGHPSQKGGAGKGKERADSAQATKIEFGLPPSMVQSLQSIATRSTQDLWSQAAFTAENATVEQLAQRSANALGRLSKRLNGNVRAKNDLQEALLAWMALIGQHLLGLAHRVDAVCRKVDEDTVSAVEEMRQVMAAQPSVTTEEQLDRAVRSLGPVWSEAQVTEVQRMAAALRAFATTAAPPTPMQGITPGQGNVPMGSTPPGTWPWTGTPADVHLPGAPELRSQLPPPAAGDLGSEVSFGALDGPTAAVPPGSSLPRGGRWRKRSGGGIDRPAKSPRRDAVSSPWSREATGRTPEGPRRETATEIASEEPELLPAAPGPAAGSWIASWLAILRFAVDNGAELIGELSRSPQQDLVLPLAWDDQAQDVVLSMANAAWTMLEGAVADPVQADLQALFLSLSEALHGVRRCANALPLLRQGLLVAALMSLGGLRDPFSFAPATAQEWLFPDLLLEAGAPLRGFVASAPSTDPHVQVLLHMPSPMRSVDLSPNPQELE
ncbi:DRC5 [Symbiodinium sp. CCMP2592]|nr:DRC5 [Symbiodinium sp. CCMP2592]